MRLLFTDENFTVAGHPVVGVPFLLDKHMEVVEAASSYLLYVSLDRGRTRSPQTWRNHGEALYDYFSWLEANEVDWRQGCRESRGRRVDSAVAAYRNWSISVLDPESGQCRLKRSTVNQRLTCLIGFYRWAEARGLIDLVPWLDELRASRQRPADFMRHARGSTTHTSADDLKLRTYVEPPKLLSQEQCKRLMSARMSYTQRLMIALMLQTGLRNEECRTFPRAYVFNPSGRSPRERIRVDLRPEDMRIKFDKPRTVYVSWQLMMELHQYLRFGERARRAAALDSRKKISDRELFINRFGEPYSAKGLNNYFRRLWIGRDAVLDFRVTPHMLRHTYATLELYHHSQRLPTAQALAWVRDRLGHQSVHTTSIYLHCIEMLEEHELSSYQATLDEMLAEAGDVVDA